MQAYLDDNNLVDLISDKHAKLRKKVIDTWEQNSKEKITDTESYMIAIIYKENTTVAQIAKKIGISRQGAHKCAKVLIERGYIEIGEHQENSREKFLCLTDKGRYFMEETLHIKRDLENQIIKYTGKKKIDIKKEIFSTSWFE